MKRTVKIMAVIGISLLTGLLISAALLTGGRCDSEQAAPTLESQSPEAPTSGVTPSSDEPAEAADEPAATPDASTPTATATPPATEASGTVACPFGQVNDPYPGQCKRYVDTNDNGICDLSEPGFGDAP
jgi:cytoskeletal protein RodZ